MVRGPFAIAVLRSRESTPSGGVAIIRLGAMLVGRGEALTELARRILAGSAGPAHKWKILTTLGLSARTCGAIAW